MCTHWSSHQQVVVILVWTVVFMNTQALRLVPLNPLQQTNNISTTTLLVQVQVIFLYVTICLQFYGPAGS